MEIKEENNKIQIFINKKEMPYSHQNMIRAIKKKERIFDFFWSPEEQQTILGLLKGRKMKKELKEHLKKKEAKND